MSYSCPYINLLAFISLIVHAAAISLHNCNHFSSLKSLFKHPASFFWIPFLPHFPNHVKKNLTPIRGWEGDRRIPNTNFFFTSDKSKFFCLSLSIQSSIYSLLHYNPFPHTSQTPSWFCRPTPAYLVYLLPFTGIGHASQGTHHCAQLWNKAAACLIFLYILSIFLHPGGKDAPKPKELWYNFLNEQVANTVGAEQLKPVEWETQQLHCCKCCWQNIQAAKALQKWQLLSF